MTVRFTLDGRTVAVPDGSSLLEALRDRLGVRSVKDGCSPQGQCGCCTVLVDGSPRVACVTPVRRVADRTVETLDGLDEPVRARWAGAFAACGASQCGFCTPGIIVRLESLRRAGVAATSPSDERVQRALAAHLCRCTGWQTIGEAAAVVLGPTAEAGGGDAENGERDLAAAARRAALEGRAAQRVGVDVALGRGGFAEDTSPPDALVAVLGADGEWVVGESLAEARALAGKVQGRRTTEPAQPPLALPPGSWDVVLRTSWVEPGYLEPDASWCEPGGEPASPLANGGAFGGKRSSPLPAIARELADRHGRAVRAVWSREDVVRLGPKRPPVAAGLARDGSGIVRVARTQGIAEAINAVLPSVQVEEIDVPGPPTSADLRWAGGAEAAVLAAVLAQDDPRAPLVVETPDGARAEVGFADDGAVRVALRCGRPMDETVVRSYAIGAAHMGVSWVTGEGLAVDERGEVLDLTVRSFGILRAADTPHIEIELVGGDGPAVNGSDAVFAAVAAAVWRRQGLPPVWPTREPLGR